MSSMVLSGDTSGAITLTVPAVAGTNTITLPANTGTVLTTASTFGATGPAFSAYLSTSQTVTTSTFTKVQINTEEFDTANCYDNSTNYRFTPNVAGYYQVNAQLNVTTGNTRAIVMINKNGSITKVGNDINANTQNGVVVSALIYMNGTTDYLEMYGYVVLGTTVQFIGGTGNTTYFQAFLARAA